MSKTEAFGHSLEPEPGFVSSGELTAADIARRDAEYSVPSDLENADDMVGAAPPEHGWPGTTFVWTLYGAGIFSVGRILFLLRDTGEMTLGQVLSTLPMMLFSGVLVLWVARKIQTFRLVGMGPAFLVLIASLLGGLNLLLDADTALEIGLGALGIGTAGLWIAYLWNRWSDFS